MDCNSPTHSATACTHFNILIESIIFMGKGLIVIYTAYIYNAWHFDQNSPQTHIVLVYV